MTSIDAFEADDPDNNDQDSSDPPDVRVSFFIIMNNILFYSKNLLIF